MADSLIVKSLARVTDTDPSDAPHGGFEAIASAPERDRDGDLFTKDDWGPLPDKITIDVDHTMDVRGTIGSAKPFFDDDGNLRISAQFASTPLAQEVRTLITEGHIDSVSVAFMRNATKSASGNKETKLELLNVGVVAVPSNRGAKVLSSKALDLVEKSGARNNAGDKKSIQAIHDASAALGASCSSDSNAASNADDGEQDGANKSFTLDDIADAVASRLTKAATSSDGDGYEPKPYHADPDETVKCPVCSKMDDVDAKYCDQCGTKLEGRSDVTVGDAPASDDGKKTVTAYVSKALANSVEDLQARLSDALSDIYERNNPSTYCYVQATFLDDGGKSGTVVYSLNGDSLSRTFTDDGNQVTLGDTVTDVTIITTIVPEGDGKDSKSAKDATTKAVTDAEWDGSASRFTLAQYKASTLIHPAEASDDKNDYKLPVKEPNGDVNSNAVHAAAGALAGARGELTGVTDEQKEQAAKTLVGLYKNQLKEDPPDSLLELAGESPKDGNSKSADTAAADVKSAAAGSADEEFQLRARALLMAAQSLETAL